MIWLAVGLVLWELCRGEEGRRVAARLGGRSLLLLALFALADAAVPWCLPHLQAQWWCLPGVLLWQCSAALPPLWVSLRFRSKWRWVAVLFWFPVLLLSLTVVRLPMVATPAAVGFDHAHRPFEVRSADGTLLRGLHFPRATPRGLVLLVHGIGAEKCQFLPAVRPLWDLGYEVWTFDQRGHGLSGGWLSSLGVREAEDVAAVWRFVVENTSLPRHRKQPQLLYGVSLGGAAAQGAAPGLEGCAGMILDSSFASLRDVGAERIPWIGGVLFDAMSALRVDLLLLGVRMLDQRLVDGAPAARGARADFPVLILHAEDDPVIAPSQGAKLAAAYGTRAHRVVLPGRGHGTGFAHAPGAHGAAIREFAASLR